MGLDMYLFARKSFYEYLDGEDAYAKAQKGLHDLIPEAPTSWNCRSVTFEVAYWRKANHIHRWFVNNVQDGNDDCGEYYVSRENILKLLEVCRAVIADPKRKGPELLPRQEGFFFGGIEYDENYIDDCLDTVKMLEPLTNERLHGDFVFYYHSSW